jgi:hypothetical protein
MTGRLTQLLVAFILCAACERASFESLGTRPDVEQRRRVAQPEAGTAEMKPSPVEDPAGSSAVVTDTASAGSGSLAAAGSGGGTVMDPGTPQDTLELTGSFAPKTFASVQSAFVIGRSDEFGTTTVYLLDHSVTCDEISTFAWLIGLPADVQVIEIMFRSTSATGSLVAGSLISHAEGGMFSISKDISSMQSLVLSRNESGGVVEGLLTATFSTGHVSGRFHAEFCATGKSF